MVAFPATQALPMRRVGLPRHGRAVVGMANQAQCLDCGLFQPISEPNDKGQRFFQGHKNGFGKPCGNGFGPVRRGAVLRHEEVESPRRPGPSEGTSTLSTMDQRGAIGDEAQTTDSETEVKS